MKLCDYLYDFRAMLPLTVHLIKHGTDVVNKRVVMRMANRFDSIELIDALVSREHDLNGILDDLYSSSWMYLTHKGI